MKCNVCKKSYGYTRNFKNFFNKYRPSVCRYCFKRNMNYYPYFVIPIQQGLLHIFELLTEEPKPLDLYIDYFAKYYKAYFKTDRSVDVIYVDVLTSGFIELLDELEVGHLIIFTNKYKEDSQYEIRDYR